MCDHEFSLQNARNYLDNNDRWSRREFVPDDFFQYYYSNDESKIVLIDQRYSSIGIHCYSNSEVMNCIEVTKTNDVIRGPVNVEDAASIIFFVAYSERFEFDVGSLSNSFQGFKNRVKEVIEEDTVASELYLEIKNDLVKI